MELRAAALSALLLSDPQSKVQATRALWDRVCSSGSGAGSGSVPGSAAASIATAALPTHIDSQVVLQAPMGLPGRPLRPQLVQPKALPQRSPFTLQGRSGLLHALAHIEFNAINLALDAVWRFVGMPPEYYRDWTRVAAEEALHFSLLNEHLATLGCTYGDFDAHDGLWTMVENTAGDVLARMALVPRTLEARGLDATPPMQARLRQAGDLRAVEILDVILRDEVGHVAIGNRWYRFLCERDGLDPVATYDRLAQAHGAPRLRGPFNVQARLAAGFTQIEVDALSGR